MCGILGYFGKKNGIPTVYNGLKTLSYRGYDSWGITAVNNGKFVTCKKAGDICKTGMPDLNSTIVIGHTRWATHGGVTNANAHPHISGNKIAVVHNGIIENYKELREALQDEGFRFKSQTDTEVIPHLINFFTRKHDFKTAFQKAIKHMKGSFAILALTTDGTVAFAKKGSPLVIGLGNNETYISSDIPSFLDKTKKIIVLEDDDYGFLEDKLSIYNNGTPVKRKTSTASWDVEVAKKGTYPHFMLKEIEEQSITIRKALNQEDSKINQTAKLLKTASRIFLAGCGTSYNVCATAAYLFAESGLYTIPVLASEFQPHLKFIDGKTVLVAVSQSGETKDLIDAMNDAKKQGAKIISIVNVPSSTIARNSDITLPMNSGPEQCVLSTKSCTSQLAIFSLINSHLSGKDKELLLETSACALHVIRETKKTMKSLAKKLADSKSIFLIGRSALSQVAREAALKIKEVSYIHAEGFPAGELKHGTIAMIEDGTPVITFADNSTRELATSNAMEVKARGAFVIGIDSKNNEAYDVHVPIPEIEAATPILAMLPIQLLAYYLAIERKCDPDKPRNLAKSVTVR